MSFVGLHTKMSIDHILLKDTLRKSIVPFFAVPYVVLLFSTFPSTVQSIQLSNRLLKLSNKSGDKGMDFRNMIECQMQFDMPKESSYCF